MPLIINSLGDKHTHTNTHTDVHTETVLGNQARWPAANIRRPAAITRLD